MIFDWNLGYTWFYGSLPAFHLADIVGVIGLSNITLFINALVLFAYVSFRSHTRWKPWLASAVGIVLALNVFGYFHGRALPAPDREAGFLVIQANIGNREKVEAERGNFRDIVADRFFRLTTRALNQIPRDEGQENPVDFIVWPETAFPEFIEEPHLLQGFPALLRTNVQNWKTKLITGGYSTKEGTDLPTNSFFVLNESGEWLEKPYHKTLLLAFGEYLPGAETFPFLLDWLPEVGQFGRGPGPSVFHSEKFTFGAQICYEGLFDWFTRGLARKGAQIVVNMTNDSWYGKTSQPPQHLYMTLAHAVEVRRPLVRSTNTGISTVVLASGEILERSPLHEEWSHLYKVPYSANPPTTIFMTWGYWLIPGLLALALLSLVLLRKASNE
jgi:apolipoprotein N-acyltransferase